MAALPDAPEGWTFGWADLEFLIAPNTGWQWDLAQRLAAEWGEEYGDEFMAVPVVVIDPDGSIHDPEGVWAPRRH